MNSYESSYKSMAEKKHTMAHNFLVKNFPVCTVEYNGVEGIDNRIIFNDRTVYVETKTCKKIVKSNLKKIKDRPILESELRLGRFKFNLRKVFPYEPLSQHTWLIENNGWYIFIVGYDFLGALPAKDVPVNLDFDLHWIGWQKIIGLCYPDWLDQLKKDVYIKGLEK